MVSFQGRLDSTQCFLCLHTSFYSDATREAHEVIMLLCSHSLVVVSQSVVFRSSGSFGLVDTDREFFS